MLTFHVEERRLSMLIYLIDLYAGDLSSARNAGSLGDAWFDEAGYYARVRDGADGPRERQLDFHTGLCWRFEEHIDETRRRIDRIGIVPTAPGIKLLSDHTWSEEELKTYSYSCPWHHNLTAAIMSFRAAKALRTNPSSRRAIDTFRVRNSAAFEWRSQQLLDLGFMETGWWF